VLKMFSVKGFAVGKNVTLSSGSAAAVIMASNIAASGAALKPAARPFTTLEELNRQALVWRDREAHGRSWPGGDHRTVAEAFAEERPRLLPLPLHRFDSDLLVPVRSGKTIYVRFDLNDYSIPPTAVGPPQNQEARWRLRNPRSAFLTVTRRLPGIAAVMTAGNRFLIRHTRKSC
jgi:hypothetical protein